MKPSTLFAMAFVGFSQMAGVSAATNPTRVLARAPDQTTSGKKGVQSPSEFPVPGAPKSQGCFSSSGNLTFQGTPDFFSSGACNKICTAKKFKVMGLQGNQCLCGNFYPQKDKVVKDSNCDFPCPGWPEEACGSVEDPASYSIFNTGVDVNVQYLPKEDDEDKKSKTTSSSASSTAESTSSTTAPAATQTQDESEGGSDDEKKSGPNTAGIAAGVVVGVAVIAGGIGGFFFWMRRRRNAEIEEDHRRNAAVNAFISGSKPPSSHGSISMTDSRLDPVMAHRRMSDGSIADNQDYSRRILRVTNA